ncbi:hypothetical protein G7046_g1283 [Stylonectria norvegica]|nr:hypothetical protein G7046_g1283 [Stylonectria norvegica]
MNSRGLVSNGKTMGDVRPTATRRQLEFFNYPEAKRGPDVPNTEVKLAAPVISGRALVIAAFIMEWVRVIREAAWHNSGFGSLRKIRNFLVDYEPRYEPTVTPLPRKDTLQRQQSGPSAATEIDFKLPAEFKFYSVSDYHAIYLLGEVTPTDVICALLPLIRRDLSPPGKHSTAWLEIKIESILKAAEQSTYRYKKNHSLGLLDGVPTAVKDEYDIDGYATTLGSLDDHSGKPVDGSSITNWTVRKLENTGAIILGKLTMHEFGLDTTGNNPHYGTPLNPFNPGYYTGGSSSGPGYAVGAGLLPIALGSDGGGSIRIPASYCSVFGLKPTHARLSSFPSPNHSPTCAVQGPLASDMLSLTALYEFLIDPHPSTQFPPLILEPSLPITKVLGIHEKWFSHADLGVQTLVRGLVDTLSAKYGYTIVEIDIPFTAEGQTAHALTVLTDGATLLEKTDNITPANKILLSLGRVTPSTDYLLAQKLRGLLMQHLAYLWQKYPGMMIITPTTACAGAPILRGAGEMKHGISDGNRTLKSMEYVWLANFCGLPALTVPAGYLVPEGQVNSGDIADHDTIGKIPVGLMATGEWCSEKALLKFGVDAEAAGADLRCRPPIWEDVISMAQREAKASQVVTSEAT